MPHLSPLTWVFVPLLLTGTVFFLLTNFIYSPKFKFTASPTLTGPTPAKWGW